MGVVAVVAVAAAAGGADVVAAAAVATGVSTVDHLTTLLVSYRWSCGHSWRCAAWVVGPRCSWRVPRSLAVGAALREHRVAAGPTRPGLPRLGR